jgi:hypothetical protein
MNECHRVKTMYVLWSPAEMLSLPEPPAAARFQRVTNLGKAEHTRADTIAVTF